MVALEPPGISRVGTVLALSLVVLWQLGIGQARPGSASCPAGEVGLCLALVAWWRGAGRAQSLALWGVGLLCASAVSGVAPFWPFAIGCPAWMLVRMLSRTRGVVTFLALAAGLVSGIRCGAKLLLLAYPGLLRAPGRPYWPGEQAHPGGGFPLTLSGATLPGSLWAELAPNGLFLLLFAALLGALSGPSRKAAERGLSETSKGGRSPYPGEE